MTIIDHGTKIMTSNGWTTPERLERHNQLMKESEEAARRQQRERAEAAWTGKACPFKELRGQSHTSCEKSCPFYADTSCIFASTDIKPTRDTVGLFCPIAGKCRETCAMCHSGGCTLIETVKALKAGKD